MGRMKEVYMELTNTPEYIQADAAHRLHILDNWEQYYKLNKEKDGRSKRHTRKNNKNRG